MTVKNYTTSHFNLFHVPSTSHMELVMEVHHSAVSTVDLPYTYDLLKTHLPSVLRSKCFNSQNLPFDTEVKNTELGHLLEHILLEYLCIEKMKRGATYAQYDGETLWNTGEEHRYYIKIKGSKIKQEVWDCAIEKTLALMQKILHPNVHIVN